MSIGPGRYDDLCTYVKDAAKAEGAIVIVFRGEHGNGFSMQADLIDTMKLPATLRLVADQIEADLGEGRL